MRTGNNKLINRFILLTVFLIIVFPNAFREIKAVLMTLLFIVSIGSYNRLHRKVKAIYMLGFIVTFFYLFVGLRSAKLPEISTPQIIFVYIVAPLFWLVFAQYLTSRYSIKEIVRVLNVFAIAGSASVFIGIWLLNHGYKSILENIIENPNQTFTDKGISAIRFHVYGSLIFLFPAFIQLFGEYKRTRYIFLIILFIITGIVSGRSALLLSIIIGFLILFLLGRVSMIKYVAYTIPCLFIIIAILEAYNVNISNTLLAFSDKVQAGGGNERLRQYSSLIHGISNNHGLGSGHGVGVDVIRSNDYPWRYELLPLATIYRVGILGFAIYALPGFFIVSEILRKVRIKTISVYDKYLFAGFVAFCLATCTDPYLESFEFQWPYFFTFIYFVNSRRNKKSTDVAKTSL